MREKKLSIRLNGQPIGVLEQLLTGKMQFTYNQDATAPISFSMPLHNEAYDHSHCEAFFGGLLPESDHVRHIIGKRFSISPSNTFELIKAIGYDCAGAISCHEMNEPILSTSSLLFTAKKISADELYKLMKALPTNPLFIGTKGLRLSLAGVQEKAAVCMIDDDIALPENGCPTTHLLKPMSLYADYEGLAENEYFCMTLAKKIGLPVPHVQLRKIDDITFLLIERYDRKIQNQKITRIHQEDFCQALSIPYFKKYQNEGGPALKNCFDLLMNAMQPAIDRNALASMVVFNFLIGNMDAHGKNFSLLHQSSSQIQLAPFYDLVCTLAYPALSNKMAMKIGGQYPVTKVLPQHWEQLCHDINYRYIAMKNLIEKLGNTILANIAEIKSDLVSQKIHHPIIERISEVIDKNISQTLKRLG